MRRTIHIGLCVGLIALGLFQVAGWATGIQTLRGIGFVSAASPLPLVFSQFRDYETFAAKFDVEFLRENGTKGNLEITPAAYAKLSGPYNRRNTFGAALSYGPALDRPEEKAWVEDVLQYSFCSPGVLRKELGVAQPLLSADVHVTPLTRGKHEVATLHVECGDL